MELNINNINYLGISCQGVYDPCQDLKIFAILTPNIYISCKDNLHACQDLNICSEGGDVVIDCLGSNSCFDGIFCDDIVTLNRNCSGIDSCQSSAPTASPTNTPTATTITPDSNGNDMKSMAYYVLIPLFVLFNQSIWIFETFCV